MRQLSQSASEVEAHRLLDERGFQRMLRRKSIVLVWALGVPLFLLVVLVVALLRSSYWVDHSDIVVAQTNTVGRRLLVMQSDMRAYRANGNQAFFQQYAGERRGLLADVKNLAGLVSDNAAQSGQVAHLKEEIGTWLADNDTAVPAPFPRADTPGGSSADTLGEAPHFQALSHRVEQIIGQEQILRTGRTGTLRQIVSLLLLALGGGALLGIPALTYWVLKILRESSFSYRQTLLAAERRARQLQVTLNSIGDAVIATNNAGEVDFLNPAAEAATGWSNAEATGRTLEEVFPIFSEKTGLPLENPVERVLRENIVVGLANHTMLRTRDGRVIPIEDSAAPIRDEHGQVFGVILVFHDVSERKALEKKAAEIQERSTFLNALGDSTRLLSKGEAIMEVATRLLGEHLRVSRCAYAEMALGSDDFVILHDYTHDCASAAGKYNLALFGNRALAAMHSGQTLVIRDLAAEIQGGEGAAMFNAIGIQAIVCCPLLKEGELRAMMAIHQTLPRDWKSEEISLLEEVVERCWATIERSRAEAEAFKRAEQFRLLSEVSAVQVWTAGAEGALDYVNQECLDYFGVSSRADILGNGWVQFVHPDDLPQAAQYWQECLATGKSYEVEFRLRRTDGHYRWFIVRARAMQEGGGNILKWFGTNTDIDDLKRAQREALQASQKKDDFIAALSHELRTPLTPVLLAATALSMEEGLSDDVRGMLLMMERNIALEARLIDDLLDVTSIARGKLQIHTENCNAHALIRQAVEIVKQDVTTKGIVLKCDLQASRHEITADPARFQQVIWNLLRNAVKFTPHDGQITVETRDTGDDRCEIRITDSGIGIEAEMIEQIFAPFEQGDITGDHRFGGLGLGLAIARAIVLAHGGTICAQSKGRGCGATFQVDLAGRIPEPLSNLAQSDTKGASTQTIKAGLRLLLVDDDAATIELMDKLLRRAGYAVVTANSAETALTAASENEFDLVISDLGLPDASGLELMVTLRDRYGLQGFALSGYGMEKDLANSLNAGFIRHLTKPVDFGELRNALANVVTT